jgi:DNA-binding MarR family transcriptional regulator
MEERPLMAQFIGAMRRFKRLNPAVAFGGLSGGEFFLLEALRERCARCPEANGVSAGNLAGGLRMSAPAVSRMLRGLESRELIERGADPSDRRNTLVRITEKGVDECLRERDRMRRLMDGVLHTMGEGDMRALLALFTRVIDALEHEISKEIRRNKKITRHETEGDAEC